MEMILVLITILLLIIVLFLGNKKVQSLSNDLNTAKEEANQAILLRQQLEEKANQINSLQSKLDEAHDKNTALFGNIKSLESENTHLKETITQLQTNSEEQNQFLKTQFKNLASEILKSNSKDFSDTMLAPLKEKMQNFEKSIKDSFEKEMRDKLDLKAEITKLTELNQKISHEANQLTSALKGDQKQQGNWGEFILESVLEKSGLVKGIEYKTQDSFTTETGRRLQPDVVVYLPEEKHIIIDSKVSLVAYEKYVNAESPEEAQLQLQQHLISVKNHLKGLSEKKYEQIKDMNSPDFVMLFMPIEASFNVTLQAEPQIFQMAWDKNIVIVNPSTLLATLRTINFIWKQEKQNKNTIKIATESGKLYDKFVLFLDSMEDVGRLIKRADDGYHKAFKQLSTGKGNIISKVEQLKEMGANASKQIENKFLDTDD